MQMHTAVEKHLTLTNKEGNTKTTSPRIVPNVINPSIAPNTQAHVWLATGAKLMPLGDPHIVT